MDKTTRSLNSLDDIEFAVRRIDELDARLEQLEAARRAEVDALVAAKDAEITRLRGALAGLRSIVRVARSPDAPINMREFRAAIDRADAALNGENGK